MAYMIRADRKFCTWNELVDKYPNKWIVVEDAVLDVDKSIKAGYLIGICDDSEIDDFVVSCYKQGKDIDYEWTTLENGVGVL